MNAFRNPSLRVRLVVATAVALSVVFAATGVALCMAMRASLRAEFDENLALKVRALAVLTEWQDGRVFLDIQQSGQLAEFERGEHPQYYQVWRADGERPAEVARSPSLAKDKSLPQLTATERPAFFTQRLPDGRDGRMTALAWTVQPDREEAKDHDAKPVQVIGVVAAETRGLERTIGKLALLVAGGCAGATVLAVAVVGWLIGRGLRPVDRVAAAIAGVGYETLSDRLPDADVPAELRPVVTRINELLGRLEEAFARERSLTADVAHELRTPLAGLRAALEVSAARQRTPAEYERTIARCVTTLDRLQAMVDNLLRLARLEAGQAAPPVATEAIDLGAFLAARWEECRTRAESRGLRMAWDVAGEPHVRANGEDLRIVVDNLFDNAITYADAGGTVRVSAREGTFTVANNGATLTAEQVGHVFDRFWRGEASRSASGTHCGLGLTMVKRLVERMHGSATAELGSGGEFGVTVQLPVARLALERERVMHTTSVP